MASKNRVLRIMRRRLLQWYLMHSTFRRLLYPIATIKRKIALNKRAPMQKALKNLQHLLCRDPVIKVDEFQGEFAVDSHSDLFERMILDKIYEPELAQYCKNFLNENRDAIDVGANVGFFTVLLAKNLNKGKKVLSIEPTTKALKRLYRNIEQNNVQNEVIVFEGVVSNRIGNVEIKTIEGKEEYSSLGVMEHPSISSEKFILEDVKGSTIDELVKKYSLDPGFMKVDVEGMEHLVFGGAHHVMETKRPVILSELSDFLLKQNDSSSQEVISIIEKYDYDIVDPVHPFLPAGLKDFGDILCIPKEHKFDVSKL